MTNVYTIYYNLLGKNDPLSKWSLVHLLKKQALLAWQMPSAKPAMMHRREEELS